MKKMWILTSAVALSLAAGCSSSNSDHNRTAYQNENPYNDQAGAPYIPPTQKGGGAAALTGHGGINVAGNPTQYNPAGLTTYTSGYTAPAPAVTVAPAPTYYTGGNPAPYESSTTTTVASGQLTETDVKFINEAARSGQAEVRLGQLMMQNAPSSDLRSYGQMLVDDHTKLNQQLAQLASQKGVALPTDLDSHQQHELNHLGTLSGNDFDKSALKDSIKDHEKAINAFQQAAQKGQDPDVRAFAQQALPTLQQHLDRARQLENMTTKTSY